MNANVTYAWLMLLSIIACLQKVNGNWDPGNYFGDTPLQVAVRNKDVDLVKSLLSNGNDVKATNDFEETALMIAAGDGSAKMIKLLLPNSNVNAIDYFGNTALDIAKKYGYNQIARLLQQEN